MIYGPNDPFSLRLGARLPRDYEIDEAVAEEPAAVRWVGDVAHDNVQSSDMNHAAVESAEDALDFVFPRVSLAAIGAEAARMLREQLTGITDILSGR